MPVDYATAGVAWEDRAQRFDETVRILRAAHTEDRFSFSDDIYSFDDVSVIPRPHQPGGGAAASRRLDGRRAPTGGSAG